MAENTNRKTNDRGIALSLGQRRQSLRAIALGTIFAFLNTTVAGNLAWAQPGVETAFATNAKTAPSHSLQESLLGQLPQAFGVVRAYQSAADTNTPFILHIQDAHSNPSAQKNIAKILQWISDQSQSAPPIIALEGVKGTLHPEYLNFFPDHPKVNQALVKHLVNLGELTGAELFAWKRTQVKGEREPPAAELRGDSSGASGAPVGIEVEEKSAIFNDSPSTIHYPRFVGRNHNQRISSYSRVREAPVFVGVEEPALYRENLGIYREFLDHEAEIKTNLDTLRRELYQRENNTLSKEAREYLREKRRRKEGDYQSGQGQSLAEAGTVPSTPQWEAYLGYLKKELNEQVKLDLEAPFEQIRFPNVVRLDVLMRAFKDLNLEMAAKEKESFLNELEKKVRLSQDKETVRAFKEHSGGKNLRELAEQLWVLALSYRMDPKAAAEFWKMTGRDILQAELDVAGLDQEMNQLEGWLEDSLAGSDEAKKVFKLGHDFDLLEKTLSLELSAKQVALIAEDSKLAPISSPVLRGRTKVGEEAILLFQEVLEIVPTSNIKTTLTPWIKKSARFYELATQRDQTLLDNTLKAARGKNAAVLITGGFHTEGFKALMQERGIGYAVIQPNVDTTGEDLYRKVLREENADVSAYFEKPDMNRQEALFFKSIVENGAAELWEKDKVPHQEIAAEAAEALRVHPVLKNRLEARAVPDGKQGSRLDLRETLSKSPTVQAVVAIPVTNEVEFFGELSGRAASEVRLQNIIISYQPIGTSVKVTPEINSSPRRSEMRSQDETVLIGEVRVGVASLLQSIKLLKNNILDESEQALEKGGSLQGDQTPYDLAQRSTSEAPEDKLHRYLDGLHPSPETPQEDIAEILTVLIEQSARLLQLEDPLFKHSAYVFLSKLQQTLRSVLDPENHAEITELSYLEEYYGMRIKQEWFDNQVTPMMTASDGLLHKLASIQTDELIKSSKYARPLIEALRAIAESNKELLELNGHLSEADQQEWRSARRKIEAFWRQLSSYRSLKDEVMTEHFVRDLFRKEVFDSFRSMLGDEKQTFSSAGLDADLLERVIDKATENWRQAETALRPIQEAADLGFDEGMDSVRSEVRTDRDWNGWAKQRFYVAEKAAILQALSEGVESRLAKSAGQRILLDVGAGHGELTAGLARLFGGGILAVEKDAKSVEALSSRGIPNLKIVQGDFFKALESLTTARPDLFLMSHSLSLYFPKDQRDELMRQALDMVERGGKFALVLNGNDVVPGSNVDIRQRFMKKHLVVLPGQKGTMKETLEQMGAAVEIQNLSIPQVTENLEEMMALASALLPPGDRTPTTLQALQGYVNADYPNGLKHTDATGKTFYQLTSQQQILWVTPPVRSEEKTFLLDESKAPLPLALSEQSLGIAGAGGNIGSFLVDEASPQVRRIDALVQTAEVVPYKSYSFTNAAKINLIGEGTLPNLEAQQNLVQNNDTIFHLAGWVTSSLSQRDVPLSEVLNINSRSLAVFVGQAQLLKRTPRIIYASSMQIYDLMDPKQEFAQDHALSEDDLVLPLALDQWVEQTAEFLLAHADMADNREAVRAIEDFLRSNHPPETLPKHEPSRFYALSKAVSERILSHYENGVSVRLGGVFGPGYDVTSGTALADRMVPKYFYLAAANQPIETAAVPKHVMYVGDAAAVLLRIAAADLNALTPRERIVNVGAKKLYTAQEFAETIVRGGGSQSPVNVNLASADSPRRLMNLNRMSVWLKMDPKKEFMDLEQAVRAHWDWIRQGSKEADWKSRFFAANRSEVRTDSDLEKEKVLQAMQDFAANYQMNPTIVDDMQLRIAAGIFKSTETGYVIMGDGDRRLVESFGRGSRRFFDTNGRWLMTIDPNGNKVFELAWDENQNFKKAWILNGTGQPLVLEANLEDGLVYGVAVEKRPGAFVYYYRPGLNLKDSPGDIPYSDINLTSGTNFISGIGSSVMEFVAWLAKDQGQTMRYEGNGADSVPSDRLFVSLSETATLKKPENVPKAMRPRDAMSVWQVSASAANAFQVFSTYPHDMEWQPNPPERIFNPKSQTAFFVRDGKIQRVYYDRKFYVLPEYSAGTKLSDGSLLESETPGRLVLWGYEQEIGQVDEEGNIFETARSEVRTLFDEGRAALLQLKDTEPRLVELARLAEGMDLEQAVKLYLETVSTYRRGADGAGSYEGRDPVSLQADRLAWTDVFNNRVNVFHLVTFLAEGDDIGEDGWKDVLSLVPQVLAFKTIEDAILAGNAQEITKIYERLRATRPETGVTLNEVQAFLDGRPHAVWYARYDGENETVEYVNRAFATVFGKESPEAILEIPTYQAINPPGSPVAQYKTEDQRAMTDGIFISRTDDPAVTVVKIKFEKGVLGFFINSSKTGTPTLDNLEPEMLETLRAVRPDLFSDTTKAQGGTTQNRSEVRQQEQVLDILRFSTVAGVSGDINFTNFTEAQNKWRGVFGKRGVSESAFTSLMEQAVQAGWAEQKGETGHYAVLQQAIPTEFLLQAGVAREAVKVFGTDQHIRTFSRFYQGRNEEGSLLATYPVKKLLYDFLLLPEDDPAYELTWRALELNWSMFAYAQIRALYDLLAEDSRKKDLRPALAAIPFQAAILKTEGGNYSDINRRTWSGRYSLDRLDAELARFRSAHGDEVFRVGDFAVSNGSTALDLARHVEGQKINIVASDYRTQFFIHTNTAFDQNGSIVQVLNRDTNQFFSREDLLPRERDEAEALYARILGSGQLPDRVRVISLIHPDVERYAREHSDAFEIRRDDVFNPQQDHTYHFIRVMGLLMPGAWSYFSDEKIGEGLAALGRRLEEGGALEIGMGGGGTDQFAFYRRSGDRLTVENMRGFSNFPDSLREILLRSEVRTDTDVSAPQADTKLDVLNLQADTDMAAPQVDSKLDERVRKAVREWLRSGNVGFQNVPDDTVLRLIEVDSRLAAIEALIKTRANTQVLNKKQRELRDSLSRALANVIQQTTERPVRSPQAKSFLTPIPRVELKKWAEIFTNAYLQRQVTGLGDYPFSIAALQDYAGVLGGLAQAEPNDGDDHFLIAGFSQRGLGGKMVGLNVAGQQQNLVEARLLRIKGGSSLPVYAGAGTFEIQPDAIIPFMGSFFRQDGTEISPEELRVAGLEWVQDAHGQDLKFPVFASTTNASRVAVIPLPVPRMIVIAEQNEFRLLSTKEGFERFITERFGAEPFVKIQQDTDALVRKIVATAPGSLSPLAHEDLKKGAYVVAMVSFLKEKDYKHAMPIVALRYKGIGNQYNFQPAVAREFAEQHDSHQQEIPLGERGGRMPEGYTLVTDSRLEGKQGVFFFPYQPGGQEAMGAESSSVLRAIQNDPILFANGATLSTINIAAVEVASVETLKQWGVSAGVNPPYVVVQVVTDDTRNLLEVSNFFELYLTTEINKNLSVARQQYLENFINFFGPNIAGIIKSNLTFSADDLSVLEESGMVRNISPLGNLRDTGELIPVQRPQESMRVILGMMHTGFFVGKLNGFSAKAWINSRYFDAMITAFVEEFEGADTLQRQTLDKIQGFKKSLANVDERKQGFQQAFTVAVTRELFEYWTQAKGVQNINEPDQELLEHIAGDPERKLLELLAVPASNRLSLIGAAAPAAKAEKFSKNKKQGRRSEVRLPIQLIGSELGPRQPARAEMRAVQTGEIHDALAKSTDALVWLRILNEYQPTDEQDKINVTLQIARGIQMKVPMLRSVLADPELQDSAYRYLAAWAYNASIIYGTSFVAAGVEGEPDLVDAERIKVLLTKGGLSNVRESLTKGDENPLGMKNYASAGKEVDVKSLTQLTLDEQETKPVSLDIQLLTHVPGVYLGIDVGGGSAKMTVVQNGLVVHLPDELRVISTVLFDTDGQTPLFESPTNYVRRMSGRVRVILGYLSAAYGIQKLDGVGINTPGAADFEANRMETLGQMPIKKDWNQEQTQWVGRELPRKIAQMLDPSADNVRIRNDMDGVLPGVASVLANAKPEFWQRTGGNFAFDWMGTGHGFQFALGGVPMNAPTEAGHMIYDFGAEGGRIFDTEALTSIPSMLSWAREMAAAENADWPEIQGDHLKPLADAVFDEGQDAETLQKKAIAQKVFERFAKNYAANLALRYHMVQGTGQGSATEVLLGGGIARGKTGDFLKTRTLQALADHGLDSKINITVITDAEIKAAGVDPDDVGPIGAAYFIQSVLAARAAAGLEQKEHAEWSVLAKRLVVSEGAKEVLPQIGADVSQMPAVYDYLLRFGGPVQKLIFKLRELNPSAFPLMPITLHFANGQSSYQPKWLRDNQAIYLKVDPLAFVENQGGVLITQPQATEELQAKAQHFLAASLGGILSPRSLDQNVRRIVESEDGYAADIPLMEGQPLNLVDLSSVTAAFVNAQEYRDLIQAGAPEAAYDVFSRFKNHNGINWPVKQLLPEWHGQDDGLFQDEAHSYLGIMNHLVYIAPFRNTSYFAGMLADLKTIFPAARVEKALEYANTTASIRDTVFSEKPVTLKQITNDFLKLAYRLLGREILRGKIAEKISTEDAENIEWNGLSQLFDVIAAAAVQGKAPELDFTNTVVTPLKDGQSFDAIPISEWSMRRPAQRARLKVSGLALLARSEVRGYVSELRGKMGRWIRTWGEPEFAVIPGKRNLPTKFFVKKIYQWFGTTGVLVFNRIVNGLADWVTGTDNRAMRNLRKQRQKTQRLAMRNENAAIDAFDRLVKEREDLPEEDALAYFGQFLSVLGDAYMGVRATNPQKIAAQGFRSYLALRAFREDSKDVVQVMSKSDQPVYDGFPKNRTEVMVVTKDSAGLVEAITEALQGNLVRNWMLSPVADRSKGVIVMFFEITRNGQELTPAASREVEQAIRAKLEETVSLRGEIVLQGGKINQKGVFKGFLSKLQGFGYGVSDVVYDIFAGLNKPGLTPAQRERVMAERIREDNNRFKHVIEDRLLPMIQALPVMMGIEMNVETPKMIEKARDFVSKIERDVLKEVEVQRKYGDVRKFRRSILSRFLKHVQLEGPLSGLSDEVVKRIDKVVLNALRESNAIFDPGQVEGQGQLDLVQAQRERLQRAVEQVLPGLEAKATPTTQAIYEMVRSLVSETEKDISSRNITAVEALASNAIKLIRDLQIGGSEKAKSNAQDYQNVFTMILLALSGQLDDFRGEVMVVEQGTDILLFARDVNVPELEERMKEFGDRVKAIITDDEVGTNTHWIQMARNDYSVPTLILPEGSLESVWRTDLFGEEVMVSAVEGRVYIRPTLATKKRLEKEGDFQIAVKRVALARAHQATRTLNGVPMEVRASAERTEKLRMGMEEGASGAGLIRTEYLMNIDTPEIRDWFSDPSPANRQRLVDYFGIHFEDIAESIGEVDASQPTTVRTFDPERDKDRGLPNPDSQYGPAFYATPRGRELLKIEILGMLQAGLKHPEQLRIMFPAFRHPIDLMAFLGKDSLEGLTDEEQERLNAQTRADIDLMNAVLDEALEEMSAQSNEARQALKKIHRGFMIETLEGIHVLEHVLQRADFISVGTTDLTISLNRTVAGISRDAKLYQDKFSQLQPNFMQAVRSILGTVSDWNKQHQTAIGVDFCGGLVGVETVILGIIAAKPDNVIVGLSRSPEDVAVTKFWISQVEQGFNNEAEASDAMKTLWAKISTFPEIQEALSQIKAERKLGSLDEVASATDQPVASEADEDAVSDQQDLILPDGHDQEIRKYRLGPKGFHIAPTPTIIKAMAHFPRVSMRLLIRKRTDVRDMHKPFEIAGLTLPPNAIIEVSMSGLSSEVEEAFAVLETLGDVTAGNALIFQPFIKKPEPDKVFMTIDSVVNGGPTAEVLRKSLFQDGVALFKEPDENGNRVYVWEKAGVQRRFVIHERDEGDESHKNYIAVFQIEGESQTLIQNIPDENDDYLNISLILSDPEESGLTITKRSEVRSAVNAKSNAELTLEKLLRQTVATMHTEQATLGFVRANQLGLSALSVEARSLAEQSGYVYDSPESIAERLNLPLLEVYGRLIRTLLEDAGEDESQIAQVRDLVTRHLGEYAKVLEGSTDANYQYLDLVDVLELNEDTAYALAILSIVRPRGDEIQLYVSGDDDAEAQKQIHFVTNSYENILRKLGASGRANLKMINVSGWDNEAIQKDMLAFATGKNGELQAAILSARADFLESIQVMKNIHRMNSAEMSDARALLFSPALLAQELDERTLDILQMKDELERLGLGARLSEHFAQMMTEIRLLAASA